MMAATSAEGVIERPNAKGYRPPYIELPVKDRIALWAWPPRPLAVLKFVFGFPGLMFPYTVLYLSMAIVQWAYLLPSQATMRHLGGWIIFLYLQNALLLTMFASAFHYFLYVRKSQGTEFKYNAQWPSPNKTFLFNSQVKDNMFWCLVSGVTVWTAYEVVTLWMYANGILTPISFSEHPIYFTLLFPLLAFPSVAHFYVQHRILHIKPIYRHVHALHHKNISPGPWSGLSMHPIEHIIYLSAVAIVWIVPAHPLHAIFLLVTLSLGPAPAHSGFELVKLRGRGRLYTGDFDHELHHKYVTVNFTTILVPLDHWLGTFCDGSPESMRKSRKRLNTCPVSSK